MRTMLLCVLLAGCAARPVVRPSINEKALGVHVNTSIATLHLLTAVPIIAGEIALLAVVAPDVPKHSKNAPVLTAGVVVGLAWAIVHLALGIDAAVAASAWGDAKTEPVGHLARYGEPSRALPVVTPAAPLGTAGACTPRIVNALEDARFVVAQCDGFSCARAERIYNNAAAAFVAAGCQ